MINPQVRAEQLANEFGAVLEHANGYLWVTTESIPEEDASRFQDRLEQDGYGARLTRANDRKPGNADVIVDLTRAMGEYRAELGSRPGDEL